MLTAPDRLIDLVAEDNAIEDTIYHLARALDAERIDLDRFLKVSCHAIAIATADMFAFPANPCACARTVSETGADREDYDGVAGQIVTLYILYFRDTRSQGHALAS